MSQSYDMWTVVAVVVMVASFVSASDDWRTDNRYMHTWESKSFSLGLPEGRQCDPVHVEGPGRFVCSVGSERNMCLQECEVGYHAVDLPDIVYLCKDDGFWWNLYEQKIPTPTPRCVKNEDELNFPL